MKSLCKSQGCRDRYIGKGTGAWYVCYPCEQCAELAKKESPKRK